ncbi:GNAT family N-acetyltransferase [Mesorhizobium sp. YR577]|uniref:GNAT family N-acetyltransferase n=1 Tax=Mesorhizobium sp. YR577 TaxID=1884373 RepID=UPI00329A629F
MGVGCISLHRLDQPGACELKRLYVQAAARRAGVGRALIEEAIVHAASLGYRKVMLDSLPSMTSAIALYISLGFQSVEPYWDNLVPGILYFGRTL